MTAPAASPRVVVLGVGNLLLGDEGVGVHCVAALERELDLPASVRLIDGGTSTHALLEEVEDLDALIIVDAVATGGRPGELVRLEGDQVPSAFATVLSPHQIGVADLLATLALVGRSPRRVVLLGIEPARIELDLELSPVVAARLPALCDLVIAELGRLGLPPSARAPAKVAS